MTTEGDALLLSEEELESLLEGIDIEIVGIFSPLKGPLEGIFRQAVRWFFWIGERLLEVLTTVGGPFWSFLQELFAEGINAGLGVGAWLGDTVADMVEWLWNAIVPLFQGVTVLSTQILGGIAEVAGDVVEGTGDLLGGLVANVSGFFQGGVNYLGGYIGDIADWMEAEIAEPARTLARDVRGMGEFLGIPHIAGAAPLFGDLLGDALAGMWERGSDVIVQILSGGMTLFFEAMEQSFAHFNGPFLDTILAMEELPDEVRPLFVEAREPTSQIGALIGNSIQQGAVGGVTGSFLGALLAPLAHSVNRRMRPTLLDPSTAIQNLFLGTMGPVDFEFELSFQGFRQGRQDQLVAAARPLIRENELRDLLRRDLIGPEAWGIRMDHLGWAPGDQELLQSLHEIIPGVTDLVRFAVREVFDPEIVETFELDSDFPEAVLPFAAAQGLSPEWTHRYWQSHWELPSLSQGFEMFHRGEIPREILELLLRVQDVMPFWRDKLVNIAYNPLTRVDTRRMHAMGVLTNEEVERAYLDQGYSPENAVRLRDFVEDFNTEEPKALFRGSAIRRFREGYTDMDGLVQELQSLGYSGPEIERFKVGAQLDYETDYTGDMLAALRDGYRKDQITEEEFREGLGMLEIVPDRIDGWVFRENFRKLPKVKAPKLKPPPPLYKRAAGRLRIRELIEMFRAERLTEMEMLLELLELAMPRDQAEATVEFEATRRELRQPPPPPGEPPIFETPEGKLDVRTLREAFRGELISDAELRTGLLDLEMPAGQARAFVTFEVTRREARA